MFCVIGARTAVLLASLPSICLVLFCGGLVCLVPGAARAQQIAASAEQAPPPPRTGGLTYALGLALIDAPTYDGATAREQKLRLLWAWRCGRFQLSGARSSGLLGAAGAERASGATADLVDTPRLRLGLGLRVDKGRSAGDDPALAGLPEVRSTLRARLGASVGLGRGWRLGLGWSSDILGRAGGGQLGAGLGYSWSPWPQATATANLGTSWSNQRYMRTNFGIAPDVALRTGRVAFVPEAGLSELTAGLALQMPLPGRWTLQAGLNLSQLQGDAAASPLTRRATNATAMLALGWRSR